MHGAALKKKKSVFLLFNIKHKFASCEKNLDFTIMVLRDRKGFVFFLGFILTISILLGNHPILVGFPNLFFAIKLYTLFHIYFLSLLIL